VTAAVVVSGPTAGFVRNDLVRLIVGHDIPPATPRTVETRRTDPLADVRGLSGSGVRDVNLSIVPGEILGASGLIGSGFAEIGPIADRCLPVSERDNCVLGARTMKLSVITPAAAIAAGISYVPGERLREGCIGELTVATMSLCRSCTAFFRGWLRTGAIDNHAPRGIATIWRASARPDLAAEALSGGNQQKVLLAKWLQLSPKLLILQEPTQGVDIGAREQIFAIIRDFASRGGGVLCLSGDHEQLALLCDRVLIFRRGRVAADLAGPDVTKDRIAHECLGSDLSSAA